MPSRWPATSHRTVATIAIFVDSKALLQTRQAGQQLPCLPSTRRTPETLPMPLMQLLARRSAAGSAQELDHCVFTQHGSASLRPLGLRRLRRWQRRSTQVTGSLGAGRSDGCSLRDPQTAQPVAKVLLSICAFTSQGSMSALLCIENAERRRRAAYRAAVSVGLCSSPAAGCPPSPS